MLFPLGIEYPFFFFPHSFKVGAKDTLFLKPPHDEIRLFSPITVQNSNDKDLSFTFENTFSPLDFRGYRATSRFHSSTVSKWSLLLKITFCQKDNNIYYPNCHFDVLVLHVGDS